MERPAALAGHRMLALPAALAREGPVRVKRASP
jgi:hypothetical protein